MTEAINDLQRRLADGLAKIDPHHRLCGRPVMRRTTAIITAPRMLDVPRPLPFGMPTSVVSSMPPPNSSSMRPSVISLGHAAIAGEKPDIASAALARAKLSSGR